MNWRWLCDRWTNWIKSFLAEILVGYGDTTWGCLCDRWATSIKSSSAEIPVEFGHATWVACAIDEQPDSNLPRQKCRLNGGAQSWGCLYDRWARATWFKSSSPEMSVKYWGANMGCLYSKWANWIKSSLAQRPVGYGDASGVACAIDGQPQSNLPRQKCRLNLDTQHKLLVQ